MLRRRFFMLEREGKTREPPARGEESRDSARDTPAAAPKPPPRPAPEQAPVRESPLEVAILAACLFALVAVALHLLLILPGGTPSFWGLLRVGLALALTRAAYLHLRSRRG